MPNKILALALASFLALPAFADSVPEAPATETEANILDELNPFDPNVEEILEQIDEDYENETGMPARIDDGYFDELTSNLFRTGCRRESCPVYARVSKSEQKLYLYQNGQLTAAWPVSTGVRGYTTPNMDRHPNGRIYDRYTSRKFPGGDYKGLGNMPYAVFIQGGFAIHGTAQANWSKLGSPASHGCIRLHPSNAYRFNRLVRQHGIRNVWIRVH